MQEMFKENGSLQTDVAVNSELMKASHTPTEDCMQPPPLLNIKCCLSIILRLYPLHFHRSLIIKINMNNSSSEQEMPSNTRRLKGKLLRVIRHNRLYSVLRG